MKALILDLDGVVNTYREQDINPENYVDPVKVARIERIVSATGAKIVISSNWRFQMDEVYKAMPSLVPYIIDRTGLAGNRMEEINQWLYQNEPENFVVIDDIYLYFPGHFITTDGDVGITDADVEKAIAILNQGFDKIEALAGVFEKISSLSRNGYDLKR